MWTQGRAARGGALGGADTHLMFTTLLPRAGWICLSKDGDPLSLQRPVSPTTVWRPVIDCISGQPCEAIEPNTQQGLCTSGSPDHDGHYGWEQPYWGWGSQAVERGPTHGLALLMLLSKVPLSCSPTSPALQTLFLEIIYFLLKLFFKCFLSQVIWYKP